MFRFLLLQPPPPLAFFLHYDRLWPKLLYIQSLQTSINLIAGCLLLINCLQPCFGQMITEDTGVRSTPPKYVDVSNLHSENQASPLYMPEVPMNLPECANQQVCSALFVRLNHTRKLCECSREFNWQCNTLSRSNDGHTIELSKRSDKKVYTQIKICEPLSSIRSCRKPTDWTLLALQSERTGKAHYVAVCRCPKNAKLEGPYTHNQPPYARIAGIRVYGMLCTQLNREFRRDKDLYPEFPWDHAYAVLNATDFSLRN